MAAYGGLVSLMNLMDQVQLYHARYPIFVDQQQLQLETLHKRVVFLQNFLEIYSNGGRCEAEFIESQIVDAVYAAQDVIESYIVGDIRARSTSTAKRDLNDHLYQGLVKVIQDMDLLQDEAMKIEENAKLDDKEPLVFATVGSYVPPSATKDPIVVLDDALVNQIIQKLIAQSPTLEIIPITGMGGIGKTTLAQHVYNNPVINQMFDIRAWITISQEFNPRELLLDLIREMGVDVDQNDDKETKYHELGIVLHKQLTGRRFLIVMDDIWGLEAWDKVKLFLPNDGKGSRVMITTRQLNLANDICASYTCKMNLLGKNESWSLLCKKVFVHGNCPSELEEIGKVIAKSCNGLPLSISVIAGVLAKSRERKYWKNIAKDISESVNSRDDELRILYTSYIHLPIHLKPCFLYFGVFPEDHNIRVSQLKKLWVAEGFLKPKDGKILEDVAYEYLIDLTERNLISIERFGSVGSMKICKIHDLLRYLCLKEAKRQKFIYASKIHDLDNGHGSRISWYHSSLLWSSETLKFGYPDDSILLSEIWKMPQLRHVNMHTGLGDPLGDGKENVILENLQTLGTISNFRCSEEVIEKIPNLRRLKLYYSNWFDSQPEYLQNLGRLTKLESLHCLFRCVITYKIMSNLEFPQSLKKLTLGHDDINWSKIVDKIGSLPHLEKLKLYYIGKHKLRRPTVGKPGPLIAQEWNSVDGHFPELKFLQISIRRLERWTAESIHFPNLERLVLVNLDRLEVIPYEIGEIPTLRSIHLDNCSESAVASAKFILEEQRKFGNQDFYVTIEGLKKFTPSSNKVEQKKIPIRKSTQNRAKGHKA